MLDFRKKFVATFFDKRRREWRENLRNLFKAVAKFNDVYDKKLKRSSFKCYSIWVEVKRCEALLDELKTLLHDNLMYDKISTRQEFSEAFGAMMQEQCDEVLYDIQVSVNRAIGYLTNFVETRKHGEDSRGIARKDAAEREESSLISEELSKLLAKWQEILKLEKNKANAFDDMIDDKVRDFKKAHIIPESANSALIKELQSLAKSKLAKDKEEKIFCYLPIVRDINLVIRDEVVDTLLQKLQDAPEQTLPVNVNRPLHGPQYLGPFGIVSVNPEFLKFFHFNVKSKTYTWERQIDKTERSRISDVIPLTVTGETKEKLKIPASATHYAFVYPVIDVVVEYDGRELDATDLIYYYGGYAYFDENDNLVQLNGLYNNGYDLYFRGPFLLPDNEKWLEKLKGRFAKVTIGALRRSGCKEFAWFMPFEFGNKNHGGFVYKYDNTHEDLPATYFEIVPVKQGQYAKDVKNAKKEGDVQKEELFREYFINNFC